MVAFGCPQPRILSSLLFIVSPTCMARRCTVLASSKLVCSLPKEPIAFQFTQVYRSFHFFSSCSCFIAVCIEKHNKGELAAPGSVPIPFHESDFLQKNNRKAELERKRTMGWPIHASIPPISLLSAKIARSQLKKMTFLVSKTSILLIAQPHRTICVISGLKVVL
jgi:hypothetical protein